VFGNFKEMDEILEDSEFLGELLRKLKIKARTNRRIFIQIGNLYGFGNII